MLPDRHNFNFFLILKILLGIYDTRSLGAAKANEMFLPSGSAHSSRAVGGSPPVGAWGRVNQNSLGAQGTVPHLGCFPL